MAACLLGNLCAIHCERADSPFLIQPGRLDAMVPVQQSMSLVQQLEKTVDHDRFELDILENAGHGDPLFESDDNMNRVFQFLDRYLK
jgi:dipeptidyl aminopeptidase/acylaminoacyl peptidase